MPQTPSRRLRAGAAALMTALLLGATACNPPESGEPGTPPVITNEWWAGGDSIFSGTGPYPGTPTFLEGVSNVSWGGNTISRVDILGQPQPTVREHLRAAVNRHGVPDNIVIHAGGADLFGIAAWNADIDVERFVADAVELDTWLRELGTQVWWTTITPMASWGATARLNPLRLAFNDGLRQAFPDRIVDCDPDLLDEDGRWLDDEFPIPLDGGHLNFEGARAHAECIGRVIGVAVKP